MPNLGVLACRDPCQGMRRTLCVKEGWQGPPDRATQAGMIVRHASVHGHAGEQGERTKRPSAPGGRADLARHAVAEVDDSRAEGPGSRRVRDPPGARGRGKIGMPPPTSTGWTLSRYSSIRPNAAASAASVAPPIAMSPSPGSARNCSIFSAGPPGGQPGVALHRRQRRGEHQLGKGLPERSLLELWELSRDGSWSAVSQYSIVSYRRRPIRWTPTPRISSM